MGVSRRRVGAAPRTVRLSGLPEDRWAMTHARFASKWVWAVVECCCGWSEPLPARQWFPDGEGAVEAALVHLVAGAYEHLAGHCDVGCPEGPDAPEVGEQLRMLAWMGALGGTLAAMDAG